MTNTAFETIPEELRVYTQSISFHIHDFPEKSLENDMGLRSPFDVLGLYDGVSMAEKSSGDIVQDIDRIFLFRRLILDYWCETSEPIFNIIRHVWFHEIGHHFGLSDDDKKMNGGPSMSSLLPFSPNMIFVVCNPDQREFETAPDFTHINCSML